MAVLLADLARKRLVSWMDARRDLTQMDVARAIGRDQTWVSRYKLGKQNADIDDLAALAAVYGHTLNELLDLRSDPDERALLDAFRAMKPETRLVAVEAVKAMAGVLPTPQPRKRSS